MHYVEWSIQKKSLATNKMKYLSRKNILSATPPKIPLKSRGRHQRPKETSEGPVSEGGTSRGRGSLASEGASNPALLPVRQQAEPQILVTAM